LGNGKGRKDCIDYRKGSDISANAESQGSNDGTRKNRRSAQGANCEMQVALGLLQAPGTASIPAFLFRAFRQHPRKLNLYIS